MRQQLTRAIMHRRVLVHLKRRKDSLTAGQLASFTDSIVDAFNGVTDSGTADVYCHLRDNRLVISDDQILPEHQLIRIKRPSFCPIHCLTSALAAQLPPETTSRGVDVGCALLLESCDGRILLTRRASHLRTFPGVWVPPGGHIEENESLFEAMLRELQEETGLCLSMAQCENGRMSQLALWESTFPPMLSVGLPIRHHVVIYMHAKLLPPLTAGAVGCSLKLDPEEVGAAVWLDRNMVEQTVAVSEDSTDLASPVIGQSVDVQNSNLPTVLDITVVDRDGHHRADTMSSDVFLRRLPPDGPDVERVSTGTKFALAEWLQACRRSSAIGNNAAKQ